MRIVNVQYVANTGKVIFHQKNGAQKNGHVAMTRSGEIAFQKSPPNAEFDFESFSLDPEDSTQFPRTVRPEQIVVVDRFSDTEETWYKYTVVIKLHSNGTTKEGDPQIVNKP
jgi:hypothetical protein